MNLQVLVRTQDETAVQAKSTPSKFPFLPYRGLLWVAKEEKNGNIHSANPFHSH